MNRAKAIPKWAIEDIRGYLFAAHPRYALMFDIGIETGLRISDVLSLQVSHFFYESFSVVERKTGKKREIYLSRPLLERIRSFIRCSKLHSWDYICFRSHNIRFKPLSRSQAYRMLSRAGRAIGIANISPHSLRRTFAQNLYAETKDIKLVSRELNHSSLEVTMLYLFDGVSNQNT